MKNQGDSLSGTWLAPDPWVSLADNCFNSVLSVFSRSIFPRIPAIDISDGDKLVSVKAEIPGISEKDVDPSHEGGVLYLKWEKQGEQEEKKNGSYYKESWSGSFSCSISLGNGVDWNKVDAKFKDNIFIITPPMIPGSETRKKITLS